MARDRVPPIPSAAMMLAVVAVLATVPAFASDQDYVRGYLDALLENRLPGLGLRVLTLAPDGRAIVAAGACLGPRERQRVARLLVDTGRVRTVQWDASTDCAAAPTRTALPPEESIVVRALPERALFDPLIADPRQPRFSISLQRYATPAQHFTAAAVALGEYFGLATGFLGRSGSSQIGLQGAVFALFNLDTPSDDLVNADYQIGVPVSYRRGPWSYLLQIYHRSSHLGDEFLLGNPGINRVNLSYEDIEGLASYEWRLWRFYGGGGYIVHTGPGSPALAPGHVQGGVEYVRPRVLRDWDLVVAADLQAFEELNWDVSQSYQAGLRFHSGAQRSLRLMLEYYRGNSPNGQFYRERLRYTGVGIYFGF